MNNIGYATLAVGGLVAGAAAGVTLESRHAEATDRWERAWGDAKLVNVENDVPLYSLPGGGERLGSLPDRPKERSFEIGMALEATVLGSAFVGLTTGSRLALGTAVSSAGLAAGYFGAKLID